MRNIPISLAWKEWREHVWKFIALVSVVCGCNLLVLRVPQNDFFGGAYWITIFSVMPLALFLGAFTAAGERARSTAAFQNALPVVPWKPGLAKLLAGALTLMAIVVIAMAFVYVLALCFGIPIPAREAKGFFTWMGTIGAWCVASDLTTMAVALSVYAWTVAAGVNCRDEVSAGARGILAMVVWWCLLSVFFVQMGTTWMTKGGRYVVATLLYLSPAGAAFEPARSSGGPLQLGVNSYWPMIAGLLFHLGLIAWFLRRYERDESFRTRDSRAPSASQSRAYWPGPPMRSQIAAIAWKQVRESSPLLLVGLAAIIGIFTLVIVLNTEWFRENPSRAIQVYTDITIAFSFLLAVVLGIGVSFNDLPPQINTFWRSRPIDPDRWYWVKLVTGGSVLFFTLYLPVLVVAGVSRLSGYEHFPRSERQSSEYFYMLSFVGLAFLAAVTMMVLLRQAIYAAIFTVAALLLGYWGVVFGTAFVRSVIWQEPIRSFFMSSSIEQMIFLGMAVYTVFIVLIGWLATRYDWGRKGGN